MSPVRLSSNRDDLRATSIRLTAHNLLTVSSLVGREAELGAVETFLRSERPCVVAIVGEPGIGKTTLWQVGVELARAQGARVLIARPTESEARLGFAGLADLLADVPDELFARLPEPQSGTWTSPQGGGSWSATKAS